LHRCYRIWLKSVTLCRSYEHAYRGGGLRFPEHTVLQNKLTVEKPTSNFGSQLKVNLLRFRLFQCPEKMLSARVSVIFSSSNYNNMLLTCQQYGATENARLENGSMVKNAEIENAGLQLGSAFSSFAFSISLTYHALSRYPQQQ